MITVEKIGDVFVMDDKSRPGVPPVGRGKSLKEALGDYVINNQDALGIKFEIMESASVAESARREEALKER